MKTVIAANLPSWLIEELRARVKIVEASDAGAELLVTSGSEGVPNAVIDALPALKLIAVFGVGVDRIDLAHAKARGIRVTNTPDVLNDEVADTAIGLIFATLRRLAAADRFVRDGRWAAGQTMPLTTKVTGKRIGILGLGRIGHAIAERVEPFAGEISYHNRRPRDDVPWRYVPDLVQLAREVDILVVALSVTKETGVAVTRDVINALGPSGVLINVARGSVVDEAALVAALTEGRLGGAGLDVFADEPRAPEALFALENVVLLPHVGSATVETRRAMGDLVLANVDAFVAGRRLPTRVE